MEMASQCTASGSAGSLTAPNFVNCWRGRLVSIAARLVICDLADIIVDGSFSAAAVAPFAHRHAQGLARLALARRRQSW
jgi:hypothetical protein